MASQDKQQNMSSNLHYYDPSVLQTYFKGSERRKGFLLENNKMQRGMPN